MSVFDDQHVDISCPKCRRKIPKSIGWIKENSELKCNSCGNIISLESNRLIDEVRNIDNQLSEIR